MQIKTTMRQRANSIPAYMSAAVVALGMLVNGCATLSPEQCAIGDWRQIGYQDGVQGYDSSRLSAHAEACNKHGFATNYRLWEQGRQEGLKHYCTPTKARALGLNNQTIRPVCPSNMIATLARANEQGKYMYRLKDKLAEDRKERKKLKQQLEKMQDGSNLDFKTEREARRYLLSLPDKIARLDSSIMTNQRQLDRLNYRN